jgi:hypothetical protein
MGMDLQLFVAAFATPLAAGAPDALRATATQEPAEIGPFVGQIPAGIVSVERQEERLGHVGIQVLLDVGSFRAEPYRGQDFHRYGSPRTVRLHLNAGPQSILRVPGNLQVVLSY